MAAYVHCNFHSCILRMQVDVSILLPEKERMEDVEQGKKGETFGKNKKYQTLYLLHGFTGDHLSLKSMTAESVVVCGCFSEISFLEG